MKQFIGLLSGLIFGFGLTLSGMTDPSRVRGFLDLFGNWDPTLAFVMGGAILVMAPAWIIKNRMTHPLGDVKFHLPDTSKLDAKLIGGAALFGIGWALGGLCPGPAVASLGTAPLAAGIFVIAMLVGMVVHSWAADKL